MGIQKIIDYVMKTPENTNPAVLRSVIKQNTSSSSGGGEDLAPFLEGTIESVTIPSDVKTLREGAFYNCTLLKAIDVESGHPKFKAVDGVLYSKDGKTLIAYPAGKEETEFTLPESVTAIGGMAFNGCDNLTYIYIGGNIEDVSDSALHGCDNAALTLLMDGAVLNEGGVYPVDSEFITAAIIPEETTYLSTTAFDTLPNIDTLYLNGQCELEVAEVTMDKSITSVNVLNLMKNLKHLIIGGNVTEIADNFLPVVYPSTEYLRTLVIGDSVKTIGNYAFKACHVLKEVEIGDNVESIGEGAFYLCWDLETVHLNGGLKTIGNEAFAECNSLKNISIPDGVTVLGGAAFKSTEIESIIIPDSVTTLGTAYDSSLSTGELTFCYCSKLAEVTIGSGLTRIGAYMFAYTAIESIDIPNNVTSIGGRAFIGCNALENITIPESVTQFGNEIFEACPDTLVIHGYAGSAAETYATEYGITFEAITE